ncbi:MAG: biotin/lipoyl-containing protein, partial [Pseudomonadota bacterium]
STRIQGTTTNLAFLERLTKHHEFRSGNVDTGLIGRDAAALTAPPAMTGTSIAIAALSASGVLERLTQPAQSTDAFDTLVGFRLWDRAVVLQTVERGDQTWKTRIEFDDQGAVSVEFEGDGVDFDSVQRHASADGGYVWTAGGVRQTFDAIHNPITGDIQVTAHGETLNFTAPLTAASQSASGASDNAVTAPMPGLVRALRANRGESVCEGDVLVVLEAMKMEHSLRAPRDGKIETVAIAEGDQVSLGQALVVLADLE